MHIEIRRIEENNWTVLILKNEEDRGHIGTPGFTDERSAKMAAEGIRHCLFRIGILASASYSNDGIITVPNGATEEESFMRGMAIFYEKLLQVDKKTSSEATKSILQENNIF